MTYYYRVCAVDSAGNEGPYSDEASIWPPFLQPDIPFPIATASSTLQPYVPERSIDGSGNPNSTWVAARYGGGTKESPEDTWLTIEFPESHSLTGIIKVGDDREVIPFLRNFRIDIRSSGQWKTVKEVRDVTTKTTESRWDNPVDTEAVRIYVAAENTPRSDNPLVDGYTRIPELKFILTDGQVMTATELYGYPWR